MTDLGARRDALLEELELIDQAIEERDRFYERLAQQEMEDCWQILRTYRMTQNNSETARRHGISTYKAKKMRLKAIRNERLGLYGSKA